MSASPARVRDDELAALRPENAASGVATDWNPEQTSWAPLNLTAVLRGEQTTEPPILLERTDGVRLVYPGRVHAFNAESESGKTWVALHLAAECITARRTVVYFDFEDNAPSIVGRLRALGVPPVLIGEHFLYVAPDEPLIAKQASHAGSAQREGPACRPPRSRRRGRPRIRSPRSPRRRRESGASTR